MNWIQALYCNQYYELKEKGKEHAARYNGSILTTFALLLYGFGLFFLLLTVVPDLGPDLEDWFRSVFGRRQGRLVGRFVAAVSMVLLYGVVKLTFDRQSVYARTIEQFNRLDESEQKRVSTVGLRFFVVSIAVLLLGILLFFLT